jgi:Tol biopolymer transport system component
MQSAGSGSTQPSSSDRLDSWKEIAAYLNRGARTVQRWEKTEDLPVHRHMHDKLGTVYAYKSEIDAWWDNRRARLDTDAAPARNTDTARFEPVVPAPRQAPRIAAALACGVALIAITGAWRFSARARIIEPPRVLPLTTLPGFESAPAFSPDGTRVAFSWHDDEKKEVDVFYKVIGGGEPVRVTDSPLYDFSPTWSPDGNAIAFVRSEEHKPPAIHVKTLGGSERKVGNFQFGTFPSPVLRWSPDSRWLIVSHRENRDMPGALFRMSVASGELVRITAPPAGATGDAGIAFSPDGRRIAFIRTNQPTDRDVYLLDLTPDMLASGQPRRLTRTDGLIGAIAWLPAENEILYAMFRDYYSTWWQVSPSGGEPKIREDLSGYRPALVISPDGKRAVFTQYTEDHNIWKVDLDTGEQTPHIVSTRVDTNPQISPDGAEIVFPSDRSGNVEVWKSRADGKNPVQLTSFPGKSAGTPRWSPDGKQIAFDVTDARDADIWVMSRDGGSRRRITSDPKRDFIPSWSADGEWIYFGSLRTGTPQIWKVPAEGGDAVQVTRNGGYGCWESADGKALYVTKEILKGVQDKGLFRVNLETGEEHVVVDEPVNWSRFTTVKNGIYYLIRSSEEAYTVNFLDLLRNRTRTLATLRRPAAMGFSVAPNGRWLLYTAVEGGAQDLMLVENFR